MSKHKYAGMYYSVKKTDDGYIYTLYNEDGRKEWCSTDNTEKDEQYYETQYEARLCAIESIQDHYV